MENIEAYIAVFLAFVMFFERVAKLTPTNSDNKWAKSLNRIATVLGARVKDNEGQTREKTDV